MELYTFTQLNSLDVSFFQLAAVIPSWSNGAVDRFEENARSDNMLFYLLHGRRIYIRGGQDFLELQDGDVMFVPSRCRYTSRLEIPEGQLSRGVCIKFVIRDWGGRELLLSGGPRRIIRYEDGSYGKAFLALHDAILEGSGEKLHSKALLSSLIDRLIGHVRRERAAARSFSYIYPAVVKIKRSPQENLSIAQLASLCCMSESTFRRKFQRYAGCSPARYRLQLRLSKGIELLQSGLYTIEQAAEVMGFSDAAHFSNAVRSYTGKTPGEIRRTALGQGPISAP